MLYADLRLVLASASPARRQLFEDNGYAFTVAPSNVEEPEPVGAINPRAYVENVAWLKAAAVAPRFDQALIVAADSIAWHGGKVIGKPVDQDDARRILTTLGGSVHELWTGVCLWLRPSDRQVAWQERSLVRMQPWDPQALQSYLESRAWEGKSGAYGIQVEGDPFVRVVEGSSSNVVGMPMENLAEVLSWLRESG